MINNSGFFMSSRSKKSSKDSWALILKEMSDARIQAKKIHALMDRVQKIVEKSSQKQEIYESAGDLLQSAPEYLDRLEASLDRMSYVIMDDCMDHLKSSMKLDNRFDFDKIKNKKIAKNVADRFCSRCKG